MSASGPPSRLSASRARRPSSAQIPVGLFLAAFSVFSAALFFAPPLGAEAAKIAVVNVQRALTHSKAGKVARTELEREKKRLEDGIRAKRDGLESLARKTRDLQLEIEQKSAIWRGEERDRKESALRNQRRDLARSEDELKRLVEESRRDLAGRQRRMSSKIIKEMRDVVEEIGKEGKYDIVLDTTLGGVLFRTKAIDITDEVIRRYDKKKR